MNKHIQNPEIGDDLSSLPYKHCLNCGTELHGMYCHRCGQEAVNKTPTIGSFVFEYFDHAVKWDHKFFSTFVTLIRRPGHLTNEYNAGKFTSQEHPLKLNMFLLLVFITLFVFFSGSDKMTNSVHSLTDDERAFSEIQFQMLVDDSDYAPKMQESPRDTILLQAPLSLAEKFPQFISNIETKEDTKGEAVDKWVAVLPQVIIEDEIVVIDDSGYYHFNREADISINGVLLINTIWEEMVHIISHYFPILFLLTAPFLSFSLKLVQRRSKIPGINHFIFALHYTAFLEFLMICIYILYLIIAPSIQLLEYVLFIGSCLYLAIAYHKVYTSSWLKAIIKSLLTSFIYFIILLTIFIVILFIACIIVVVSMNLE